MNEVLGIADAERGQRFAEVSEGAALFLVPKCYVSLGPLTWRLTSVFGERKNRAAMITAIRKPLDTCAATGCYSPSWSHSLLGQLEPRVNTIKF